MNKRRRISLVSGCGLVVLATALWPSTAEAHLVTTGLGPVYDGVSHVLMSPEDLLPILAMALLAGLNGPAAGRRTLFILTGAWLAGGMAGYLAGQAYLPDTLTCLSFLVLGGLTAADLKLPLPIVTGLAIALGLLHGWLNGAGIAEAQREALGLAGICSTIFILAAVMSALVISMKVEWMRIVVRVAGSWVAAIGLLMFGWSLR